MKKTHDDKTEEEEETKAKKHDRYNQGKEEKKA